MTLPSMTVFKGFFAKYAVIGLLLTIAAGAVYHLVTVVALKSINNEQRVTISGQATIIGRLQGEVAGLQVSNESFKTMAATQNEALSNILLAQTTNQKRVFEELTRVTAESVKLKDAYSKIFAAQPISGDPCVSAEHVIKKYLDQRKKEVVK